MAYTAPNLVADSDLSTALDRILEAHEREILKARGEPAAGSGASEAQDALERRLEELGEIERRLRRELERERLSAREAREHVRRYQDGIRASFDRLVTLRHVAVTGLGDEPAAASLATDAAPALANDSATDALPIRETAPEAYALLPRKPQGLLASLLELAAETRIRSGSGLAMGLLATFVLLGALAMNRIGAVDEPEAVPAPHPSVRTSLPPPAPTPEPTPVEIVALPPLPEPTPVEIVALPPLPEPTPEEIVAPPPLPAVTIVAATPLPTSTPSPASPSPRREIEAMPVAPEPRRRPALSLAERKLWETLTRQATTEKIRFQATLGGSSRPDRAAAREVEAALLVEGRDEGTSLDLDAVVRGLGLRWNGSPPLRARLLPGAVPTRVLGPPLGDGSQPTQSLSFVVVFTVPVPAAGEADTELSLELPRLASVRLLWPSRLLAETLVAKR